MRYTGFAIHRGGDEPRFPNHTFFTYGYPKEANSNFQLVEILGVWAGVPLRRFALFQVRPSADADPPVDTSHTLVSLEDLEFWLGFGNTSVVGER